MTPDILCAMLDFANFLASILFLGQKNAVKIKQLLLLKSSLKRFKNKQLFELGQSEVANKKTACIIFSLLTLSSSHLR